MNGARYILKMRFLEESYPDLLDISSLLYDLELSHDYGVLLSEKLHWDYQFSRFFWYRKGRPIEAYNRVKAAKITKASPLELTLVIASVGALWVLLQIIEKVANWPLNRKKLRLETEKLELEVAEKRSANLHHAIMVTREQRESREGAAVVERQLVQRLAKSNLALLDIEVELFEENPEDHGNKKG
jgi:hypothetical protein